MHSAEKQRPHGMEAYAVNRIGHEAGHWFAAGIWKNEWIRRMAARYPGAARLMSEGAVALTSLLEMGGDSTLVRLINFMAESLSMENLELLQKFEKDPENKELAAQVEKIGQDAGAKAGEGVYVALYHIHKSRTCPVLVDYEGDATPPAFGGKPGQPPRVNPSAARIRGPLPMADALTATDALCGKCYPAVSVRKPEEKQEKPKEIVPGRNFLEYVMRLKAEDAPRFETFWRCYLERLEGPDGPALAGKF